MEEYEFLLKDENILDVEICECEDKGKQTTAISLTVGLSTEKLEQCYNEGCDVSSVPTAFEIVFTKKDLRKMLKLLDY